MKPTNTGSIAADGEESPDELRASFRRVAHDINGVLNTLALNIELLDRSTAGVGGGLDGAAEGARERCLATLRRAVGEIQQIVAHRLLTIESSGADPAPLDR